MEQGLAPIYNQQTEILILGSAPSQISLKKQQYYGNNGNQFWKILFEYFDLPLSTDYNLRVEELLKHHLGLWDVYASFNRAGSLDSSFKETQLNDFQKLWKETPHLRLIVANGQKAYSEILAHDLFPDLHVVSCHSTSGANNGNAVARREQWFEVLGKKLI